MLMLSADVLNIFIPLRQHVIMAHAVGVLFFSGTLLLLDLTSRGGAFAGLARTAHCGVYVILYQMEDDIVYVMVVAPREHHLACLYVSIDRLFEFLEVEFAAGYGDSCQSFCFDFIVGSSG